MNSYLRAALLSFAGGCGVWLGEPGHAAASVTELETAATHEAVVLADAIEEPGAATSSGSVPTAQ